MKKWLALVSITILAFASGYLIISTTHFSTPSSESASLTVVENSPVSTVPTAEGAPALWASSASSIPELLAEADLVIRARVANAPEPRVVSFSGPIVAEDGTIIGEGVDKVAFSDTEMEVIEVYKGLSQKFITVMQTGGRVDGGEQQFWLEGDPLYIKGEEVILFLVDISNDSIHAKGRALYRTVNPAGRYTIQGFQVLNSADSSSTGALPNTLAELVGQIKEAMK